MGLIDEISAFLHKNKKETCDPLGFGLDGKPVILSTEQGFMTKTRNAREPGPNETMCTSCFGDGWDADSGGGMYICPECGGTGVVDGRTKCAGCGHPRKVHYADGNCWYPKIRDIPFDDRECKCSRFITPEKGGDVIAEAKL